MAWEAIPEYFNKRNNTRSNFILTCVDNVKSRLGIAELMKKGVKKQ